MSADKIGGNAIDDALSALKGLEDLMPHEISPNEISLEAAFDLIYSMQNEIFQMRREIEDFKNGR